MKKIFAITFVGIFTFWLCACSQIEICGIDCFSPADCTFGLSKHLYPSNTFLTEFKYDTGDYVYVDSNDFVWGYATAISYLRYSSEDYAAAKDYCLNNFDICQEHQLDYKGYHFMEHLCYTTKVVDGSFIVACRYPEIFNMFAYNDQTRTLLFLGYYNGNPDSERELAVTDFEAFLEQTYSGHFNLEESQ